MTPVYVSCEGVTPTIINFSFLQIKMTDKLFCNILGWLIIGKCSTTIFVVNAFSQLHMYTYIILLLYGS